MGGAVHVCSSVLLIIVYFMANPTERKNISISANVCILTAAKRKIPLKIFFYISFMLWSESFMELNVGGQTHQIAHNACGCRAAADMLECLSS